LLSERLRWKCGQKIRSIEAGGRAFAREETRKSPVGESCPAFVLAAGDKREERLSADLGGEIGGIAVADNENPASAARPGRPSDAKAFCLGGIRRARTGDKAVRGPGLAGDKMAAVPA